MADEIRKTVITEFVADTSQYEPAIKNITKETQKATDATKELGNQSEEAGKSMGKSVSGVLGDLGKVVPGLGAVGKGFKNAEKAATQFGKGTKAAIISTGVGLLVIAVTELIGAFNSVKDTADEDLSFMQKKLKDVGEGVKGFFAGIVQGVKDWIDRNGELLDRLTKLANFLTFGLAGKVIEYTKEVLAARDAHNAWVQSIKDNEQQLLTDIALKDRELQIAKARGASEKELIRLQGELNALRFQANELDGEALQTAIELQNIRLQQIAADERRMVLIDEYLQRADPLNQMEKDRFEQMKGQLAVSTELNTNAMDSILLAQQTIAVKEHEMTAAEERYRAEQDALSSFNKVLHASMVWQKLNAAKEAVVDGATAIGKQLKSGAPWPLILARIAAIVAITAKQIKDIKSVVFAAPAFADGGVVPGKRGGMIRGRSHSTGGVKFGIGGYAAEAEGGEFIINRKATKKFFPLINAINNEGLKYANGGIVSPDMGGEAIRLQNEMIRASQAQRPVLVLEDFRRASTRLDIVESLSKI